MHRSARRLGSYVGALVLLAAAPTVAFAREAGGAAVLGAPAGSHRLALDLEAPEGPRPLHLLERPGGSDRLDLGTPELEAPAKSRLLAALFSIGGTAAGTMLGLTVLTTGRDMGPGAVLLAVTGIFGPSLGQFYLGRERWGWLLTGTRAVAVGMMAWGIYEGEYWMTPIGNVGLVAWLLISLVDLVSLAEPPPGPLGASSTRVAVTPWLSPDGGGGLALAGRIPW